MNKQTNTVLEVPSHLAADWGITAVADGATYSLRVERGAAKLSAEEMERIEFVKALRELVSKGGL